MESQQQLVRKWKPKRQNTQANTKANVRLYAVEGDSEKEGKSNHNIRNNKPLRIKGVHEDGVHETVKNLKEYDKQKHFLNKGGEQFNGNLEQKPGSMYEKVGLEFTHQWAWELEEEKLEISKVQIELKLTNNNLNMPTTIGGNGWWTWPDKVIIKTSLDGTTWTEVNNQTHKHASDWLGANNDNKFTEKKQGQVNIPNWNQTRAAWETGAEFHKRLTNDTGKLVTEFEPTEAKYVQITLIPKQNTREMKSGNMHELDTWYIKGTHNLSNSPGTVEWKAKTKTTGNLDTPIFRVGFWGPSESNPYKVAQQNQTAGGLTKTPGTILVEKKVKTESTSSSSTGAQTNPQTVEVNNGATVTIDDYDLTSWKVSDFWIKFRDEDKLTIISPKMAFNIKEVKKYYKKQETPQTSAVSNTSSDTETQTTNNDPVAVELEIRPEDQPNNVFRVILGKVPKHDTFKGTEQKQVDSLNKDNKLLKYLLKIDIDRWEKVEVESHYKTEITNLFKVLKTKLEGKDTVVNTEHLKDWADLKNKILDYKVYPKPEVKAQEEQTTTGGDSSTSSTGDASSAQTQTNGAGGSSSSSSEASSAGTSQTTSS